MLNKYVTLKISKVTKKFILIQIVFLRAEIQILNFF